MQVLTRAKQPAAARMSVAADTEEMVALICVTGHRAKEANARKEAVAVVEEVETVARVVAVETVVAAVETVAAAAVDREKNRGFNLERKAGKNRTFAQLFSKVC